MNIPKYQLKICRICKGCTNVVTDECNEAAFLRFSDFANDICLLIAFIESQFLTLKNKNE